MPYLSQKRCWEGLGRAITLRHNSVHMLHTTMVRWHRGMVNEVRDALRPTRGGAGAHILAFPVNVSSLDSHSLRHG